MSSKKTFNMKTLRLCRLKLVDVLSFAGVLLVILNALLTPPELLEDVVGAVAGGDAAPIPSCAPDNTKLTELFDAMDPPSEYDFGDHDTETAPPPPTAPRSRTLELDDAPFPDPQLPLDNSMTCRIASTDTTDINWEGTGQYTQVSLGINNGAPPVMGLGFNGASAHETLDLVYEDGQGGHITERALVTHIHAEEVPADDDDREWHLLPLGGLGLQGFPSVHNHSYHHSGPYDEFHSPW